MDTLIKLGIACFYISLVAAFVVWAAIVAARSGRDEDR